MTLSFSGRPQTAGLLLFLFAAAGGMAACQNIAQDPPSTWSYDSRAVVIYNPDWGVIPLPNDVLNNAAQLALVHYPYPPGETPAQAPSPTLDLPIITADLALAEAQMSGRSVKADDPLSIALKRGQNRLNGFITSSTPTIPFSQVIDPSTLLPYDPAASDAEKAKATLFFLDISDEANPQALAPSEYTFAFDWEGRRLARAADGQRDIPYYLTFSLMSGQAPRDFPQGHRYLIVLANYDAGAVRDGLRALPFAAPSDGDQEEATAASDTLFQRDTSYYVFAAAPTFTCSAAAPAWCAGLSEPNLSQCCAIGLTNLAPDGSLRNNLLPGSPASSSFSDLIAAQKAAVRKAESARQITNDGLLLWQKATGQNRRSDHAIVSYSFSITSNPQPSFGTLSPLGAFSLAPTPGDTLSGCPSACKANSAAAPLDATPQFTLSRHVAPETVTSETVKLFKISGAVLTPVEATVTAVNRTDGTAGVTLTPTAALEGGCTGYLVAVTSGILDLRLGAVAPAAEQTYFSLARAAAPLIDENGLWASPLLDSRYTAMLTLAATGIYKVDWSDPNSVAKLRDNQATKTLKSLFATLEGYRKLYDPLILALLAYTVGDSAWLPTREDLALLWTFHTQGLCQGEGGGL